MKTGLIILGIIIGLIGLIFLILVIGAYKRGRVLANNGTLSTKSAEFGTAIFNNSITINGNSFNNVYELSLTSNPIVDNRLYTLYYNTTIGIIGARTSENEYWHLVP